MPSRLLLVFLKEPLPSQVKTRLAAGVGSEQAVTIYRAMVHILLQQLGGLEDCQLRICYAPDNAQDAIRFWILPEIMDSPEIDLDPDVIDFRPQGEGDLGVRLARATLQAFDAGFQKVAVIGSDCIEISSRWIHAAFAQLNEQHDAVIGPTPDGGYHILATKRAHLELFEGIPWSSSQAFATTLTRAEANKIATYQLPSLPDIDTEEDYQAALAGPLGRRLQKLVEQATQR
ncbi:MAG: TIGR04282 family arsenosugar biosynthesis glycosyltransferase [Roseibacillus sp.]